MNFLMGLLASVLGSKGVGGQAVGQAIKAFTNSSKNMPEPKTIGV